MLIPHTSPPQARFRPRVRLVAALAALLLGALTACDSGGDKTADSERTQAFGTGAARAGGTLTLSLVADSRALDPFSASLSSATDYTRMNALYDVLLWGDPTTDELHPKTAESLASTDRGKTWTLKLRPGIRFSDGTPYDAAAVKFTWERHADPATRSLYATSARGVTTEVVDPLTLSITLDQPNSRFDQIVATHLGYIVAPGAYQADPKGFARKPVGAGPFLLKDWTTGVQQTYVRNPDYWQQGKPHLDQIDIKVVQDQEQALSSVRSGQLDMTVTVSDTVGAEAVSAGLDTQRSVVNGAGGVQFNAAKAPFDDPRARQALSLAISRDDFNKFIFEGDATPAYGLFADDSQLVDHNAVPKMDTDPAQAAQLAGELSAEGKPIDFTLVMPQSPQAAKMGEYLQAKWNALPDVHVRVESVDVAALAIRTTINRDFQAVYYGMASPRGEPVFWNYLHSLSPNNYLGFASSAVDAALQESRQATTADEVRAAYTKLAQAYAAEVPVMPLVLFTTIVFARPDTFVGLRISDAGSIFLEELGLKA